MQNMNTNADIQDDDGKDETNAVHPDHPPRIIPKPQTNNSSKMENDDEDSCKCGNPSSHQYECALYCGNAPCWDTLVKLPRCDHYLHEECLEHLLYTRLSSCPLCRSSIDQWRRSKHYHHIEEEIADAFRADTDLALQLSKKLYEEEQRRKKALEKTSNESRETDSSESSRDREQRDRDRNNNRNRNRNRSRDEDDNLENRNRNNHSNRSNRLDDDNSENRRMDRDRDRAPSRDHDRDRNVNHSRNRFRSFFNRARSRSRSRHRRNTNSR